VTSPLQSALLVCVSQVASCMSCRNVCWQVCQATACGLVQALDLDHWVMEGIALSRTRSGPAVSDCTSQLEMTVSAA
jgi:hypothetical protein